VDDAAAVGVSTGQTGPGRAMRADARRNRERLLEAARELLADLDHDCGMDEIAARAGVGVGTLYRNFPRRVDLVEAIYREDLEALGTLAGELGQTHEPFDALAGWLLAFVRFAEDKRAIMGELGPAFDKDPELGMQSRRVIDGALDQLLGPAAAAGSVRRDLTANDLVHLVGGMVMSIAADPSRNDYLLGIVLDGIRPPGVAAVQAGSGPSK
jgi:AcrR family transcriptional regulator